jgi:hypothetical protein
VRVPEAMNLDIRESCRVPCQVPYLVAEPVGGDMPVGVARPRCPWLVFPARAAPGPVVGIGAAAVLAAASRGVLSGEGAVPVPAVLLVRLGHPRRGPSLVPERLVLSWVGGW